MDFQKITQKALDKMNLFLKYTSKSTGQNVLGLFPKDNSKNTG